MNRILFFLFTFSCLSVSAQFEKKIIKQIEKSIAFLPEDTLIISNNDVQIGAHKDSLFGKTCLGEKGWQSYYVNLEGDIQPSKMKLDYELTYELPSYIQVKVGGLYIHQFEVSNEEYRQFVDWTRAKNPDQLTEVLLDSQEWKKVLLTGIPMMTYYHFHPAYNNYPVVNVSHRQAEMYLEWLTHQYNESSKRKYKKVRFRLPTEAEWMYAYLGGESTFKATYNRGFRRRNGLITANFITIQQGSIIRLQNEQKVQTSDSTLKTTFTYKRQTISNTDTFVSNHKTEPNLFIINPVNPWTSGNGNPAMLTTVVKSYWPNGYGLYNMAGNVAEFVAMDGIAKGGHWNTTGFYLMPNSRETFMGEQSASPTRGFRWVMEIIEE